MAMRVFTFISKNGDGWPLAQRIRQEGHRVVVYINDKDKRGVGDGIVEKSQVKETLISESGTLDKKLLDSVLHPNPDCVVFDMVGNGFGKLADSLRTRGIPTVGGSSWGDRVELDRPFGGKVMKTMGITTPKTYQFTNYEKAIAFVQSINKPFVYKPSGNQPTTTTYVAEGPADLIGILRFYSDIEEEFELQEKVDGIEISTELWFNGKEVVNVNHTMEEKSLMEGGIGPKTGCMGSVVWLGSTDSRLFKDGVGKMVPALRKFNYRGPLDLNTIVNKETAYGLEFTARFGYDAIFILLEMMRGRVNDLFYSIAAGLTRKIDFRAEFGLAIDLVVPPHPLAVAPDLYKDTLIHGLSKNNLKHIWMYDVHRKKGQYLTSGNGGNVLAVTARGDRIGQFSPIRDAKRRALRTVGNLVIPDVMYRRDIGDRVARDMANLKEQGWL